MAGDVIEACGSGAVPQVVPERSPRPLSVVEAALLAGAALMILRDGRHHHRWPLIVGSLAVAVTIHVSALAAAGRAAGLVPERIGYFFGGALIRSRVGRTWWVVGWFPLGGSATFPDKDDGTGRRRWTSLPWPLRAVIPLAGPAAVLACALSLLGPSACRAAVREYPIQLAALLNPAARPQLAAVFLNLLDHAGTVAVAGQFALAMGTINLLPSPIFNGGQSLQFLVQGLSGKMLPNWALIPLALLTAGGCVTGLGLFATAVAGRWLG